MIGSAISASFALESSAGGGAAAFAESEEGNEELNQEAHSHQSAGNVREDPTGVTHHLQDAGLVVVIEACLVEG